MKNISWTILSMAIGLVVSVRILTIFTAALYVLTSTMVTYTVIIRLSDTVHSPFYISNINKLNKYLILYMWFGTFKCFFCNLINCKINIKNN